MFDGKKILITGGTGSLGQALTKRLLKHNVDTIRIFSRNEDKQVSMEAKFNDKRLRFFVGDIRDLERLKRAVEDVDIVFHVAALKHVPKIEYNPFEAIKTNVIGSQNVIDACLYENVEKAVCVGTDKAVSPLNTYGATKLLMEKLFVTANHYLDPRRHKTIFVSLRYGNVLGSNGSILPLFINQIKNKQKLTITDPNMTRFSITMDEALDFILESTSLGKGSEIFVPKLKAYSLADLKQAVVNLMGNTGEEIIGIRSGEKLHEVLINKDEMRYTFELKNSYIILRSLEPYELKKVPHAKKVEFANSYSSENVDRLSVKELEKIIKESYLSKTNLGD